MTSTYLYGANVHANGIRQHYLRYGGQGPALILVPGITSPAVTWGFVAERLAQTHDVYVLDVRGRGLSEAGPLDYGFTACAADVAAFAEALDFKEYVLLGHSMGARIGVRLAHLYPARLAKLVMVDPPVSGPGRREYPSNIGWYVDSIRLAVKGTDAAGMRPYLPSWTEEQLSLRAEWLHTCSEEAVVTTYRAMHEDDMHADLAHIGVPTLLVVAGKAGVILPEDVAEIRNLLSRVEVAEVPAAGHMIPWDDFAGFFGAIGGFLEKTPAT